MKRAPFITIEGIEGAGKSTCLARVVAVVRSAGLEPLVTREPGGTELGERLRELLLDHRQAGMADDTELLLMFAARAQHLAERIRPALAAGTPVVCDRFTDATYAYQGGGRGLPAGRIRVLEDWVQQGLRPDLTLLLDLPPEVGLARARRRSQPDRFEREKLEFHRRVRQAYLTLARAEPQRIQVVDAARPMEEVEARVTAIVESFLEEWR